MCVGKTERELLQAEEGKKDIGFMAKKMYLQGDSSMCLLQDQPTKVRALYSLCEDPPFFSETGNLTYIHICKPSCVSRVIVHASALEPPPHRDYLEGRDN